VVQVIVVDVAVKLLAVTPLITGTVIGVEKMKLADVAVPAESTEIAA
jgi:hypothetical protein